MSIAGTIFDYSSGPGQLVFPAVKGTLLSNNHLIDNGTSFTLNNTSNTVEYLSFTGIGHHLYMQWTITADIRTQSGDTPGDIGFGLAGHPTGLYSSVVRGAVDVASRKLKIGVFSPFYLIEIIWKERNIPAYFNLHAYNIRIQYNNHYMSVLLNDGTYLIALRYTYNLKTHTGNPFSYFGFTQSNGINEVSNLRIHSDAKTDLNFIAFGDSITDGRTLTPCSLRYADRFAAMRGIMDYAVVAQSGATTGSIYFIVQWAIDHFTFSNAVLLAGDNDNPNDIEAWWSSYSMIIQLFLDSGINVYALAQTPDRNADYLSFSQRVMSQTTSYFTTNPPNGATYRPIDIFSGMVDPASPTHQPLNNLMTDAAHPNAAGHQIIATTLNDII